MFLIALAAEGAAIQSGSIGSFRHGQWQGACFRDGFLAGQDDEVCRAHWTGDIDVSFDRDAAGLTLFVSVANPAGRQCSKLLSFSPRNLARRGRAVRFIAALNAGARTVAKQCAVNARLPTISAQDLRATLRETDGLTHLAL